MIINKYIESSPAMANAMSIGQIIKVIKDKLILVSPEPTPIESTTPTTTNTATTITEDEGDDEDEEEEEPFYDAQEQSDVTVMPSPRRTLPSLSVTLPTSYSAPYLSTPSSSFDTPTSSSPSPFPTLSLPYTPPHLDSSLLASSRSEPGLGQPKPPPLQKYLTSPELNNRRELGMKKSFSLFNINTKKGPRPEQEIHICKYNFSFFLLYFIIYFSHYFFLYFFHYFFFYEIFLSLF